MAFMNYLMGIFLGLFAFGISCIGIRILAGKDAFKERDVQFLQVTLFVAFQYVFFNLAKFFNEMNGF